MRIFNKNKIEFSNEGKCCSNRTIHLRRNDRLEREFNKTSNGVRTSANLWLANCWMNAQWRNKKNHLNNFRFNQFALCVFYQNEILFVEISLYIFFLFPLESSEDVFVCRTLFDWLPEKMLCSYVRMHFENVQKYFASLRNF